MTGSFVHRLLRCIAPLLALCATLPGAPASAEEWQPSRQVEFVVPSGPGAALDLAAREMLNELKRQNIVTQPMLVLNRSGASGAITLQTLAQHASDAHWLATFTTGMLNARAIGTVSTTYEEMTPLAVVLEEAVVVAVRTDSPIRGAADLVARLKAAPDSLSIGVATAIGNHIHAGVAKPLKVGGVDIAKLRVVPFKSSAESMTALLGGHLDVVAATTPNVISQMQAGRIRVIAVATARRLDGALSSIPTWTEQGIPAVYSSVQGVLGPKGMTQEQVRFWENALRKVCESRQWQQFVAKQNWRPVFMGSAEMAKYMETEYVAAKHLITDLKLDTTSK